MFVVAFYGGGLSLAIFFLNVDYFFYAFGVRSCLFDCYHLSPKQLNRLLCGPKQLICMTSKMLLKICMYVPITRGHGYKYKFKGFFFKTLLLILSGFKYKSLLSRIHTNLALYKTLWKILNSNVYTTVNVGVFRKTLINISKQFYHSVISFTRLLTESNALGKQSISHCWESGPLSMSAFVVILVFLGHTT